MDDPTRIQRRVARERAARKAAEALLETKSLELYHANEALREAQAALEARVRQRTAELEAANAQLRDEITERERIEAALALARDEALEASQLKSEFLANISHEIRTPMNGVIGMTSLLAAQDLTPEQRGYVATIRQSGETLLALLNDLLDLSKIEAGHLELEAQWFDWPQSIQDVANLFAPQAREKGLALATTLPADFPEQGHGDATRIRQILSNLISNAVKFTEAGRIDIVASATPHGADRHRVQIVVRDTGIGIPADLQETLFEPFRQADASTTRRYGGTGLGLSISKRLAEHMHGTLTVESTPGVGSSFTLSLTLATRKAPAHRPAAAPPSAANTSRNLRILLVEDNLINQHVARQLLQHLGLAVDLAENGHEALDAVAATTYDLVLMDMQMPEMDGIEATRRIRAHRSLPQQPIIVAMTANASEADRERCRAAGMDGFVAKPIQLEDLEHVLTQIPHD